MPLLAFAGIYRSRKATVNERHTAAGGVSPTACTSCGACHTAHAHSVKFNIFSSAASREDLHGEDTTTSAENTAHSSGHSETSRQNKTEDGTEAKRKTQEVERRIHTDSHPHQEESRIHIYFLYITNTINIPLYTKHHDYSSNHLLCIILSL